MRNKAARAPWQCQYMALMRFGLDQRTAIGRRGDSAGQSLPAEKMRRPYYYTASTSSVLKSPGITISSISISSLCPTSRCRIPGG